ncbi:uncharacterized protein Z520_06318 [Fonsecaea multimorphosa CBS 102226]|uniref:Zn(2)-C6 fungal-type domain-containing protein n=1 Tax=Fonsecaea multimorphosa CBS 102226 TaxID=1442371 RepID=A0A0D2KNE0_9EURO|nr:uncharacterized protein Z520_06318 [Fonsecaea multimorphosa CBS 102226]KIX98238.1 hypothetical protein Z520_06318 [Fonsecaea multimorphosa CBS 102226]OAL22628.1 hypothetical protein AYO22_07186 [Fonsecaea multimorphosa]
MDVVNARSGESRSACSNQTLPAAGLYADVASQCNEVHPVCNNCERRQIFCDFSVSPGSSKSPSTAAPDVRRQGSQAGSVSGSQRTPTLPIVDPFQQPDLVSTKKSTDLDVTDLRLMHHFTSVVALDLANAQTPEAQALWQVHAVKLGLKHEFLLRGILAVSAFHLAYLYPDRKAEYELIGTTHQSLGLTEFQETLAHVDETNCQALFAFSCLLIVLAFASSAKDKPEDFTHDVLHWFYLLRGANMVLNMHHDTIRCSFLKPLLDEMAHMDNIAAYRFPDTDQITKLFRVCGSSEHDKETAQAIDLAIHSLLSTFIQASLLKTRGDGTVLATFVWPINLPPKFLDLLSEKQPEAMVILAHYCVLIYWGETHQEDNWFISGWAKYMLETVKESIPDAWQEQLEWPIMMITKEHDSPSAEAASLAPPRAMG